MQLKDPQTMVRPVICSFWLKFLHDFAVLKPLKCEKCRTWTCVGSLQNWHSMNYENSA